MKVHVTLDVPRLLEKDEISHVAVRTTEGLVFAAEVVDEDEDSLRETDRDIFLDDELGIPFGQDL